MYKLTYWTTKTISPDGLMIFNWRTNKSVIVFDQKHPAYKLNSLLEFSLDDDLDQNYFDDIGWLVDEGFLTDSNGEDEPLPLSTDNNKDQDLHLILLPAGEACNLNCIYCYEDHSYKKRMDELSAIKLINFIKLKNPPRLNLEYFGGEPMLNIKFISLFSEYLKREKIKFYGSITTNGTLLNEDTLNVLYVAGIRSFQITVDGPKNLHNKLRISKSNALDSYESVCRGIKAISSSSYKDLTCIVRINSNEETIKRENIDALMKDISKIISPGDARFLILPKPIGDYSSANLKENLKAADTYCSKGSVNEVVSILEDKFEKLGYFLADSVLLTKKKGYSCYAGDSNSFVINPDLKLMKCTVALDDPINNVGWINDDQYILNENFQFWTKNYYDSSCNKCFANQTCTGNSCPLVNIKNNKKNCPPIKMEVEKVTAKAVRFYERISDENC